MKTLLLFPLFLSMSMTFGASSSFARGVESSGGADLNPYMNAWFQSATPGTVKTCFVISSDFGMTDSDLAPLIESTFSTWQNYMAENLIQYPGQPVEGGTSNYIATQTQLMSQCDGSEDLKIYFGSKDAQVLVAMSAYQQPFGFVQLTSDSSQIWGKGFMYIATPAEVGISTWKGSTGLQGLLLHELGHILGCAHINGTIMDANLADEILGNPAFGTPASDEPLFNLSKVDQYRQLYWCNLCSAVYPLNLNLWSLSSVPGLLGVPTARIKSGQFNQTAKIPNSNGVYSTDAILPEGDLHYTLIAGDGSSQDFSLHLKTFSMLSEDGVGDPSFKTNSTSSQFGSYSQTFLGNITKPDGSTAEVSVSFNTSDLMLQVQLLDGSAVPPSIFATQEIQN